MRKVEQMGSVLSFRQGHSPVHRLGPGWKLMICTIMSLSAFAARSDGVLAALLAANALYYLLAGLRPGEIWRDLRLFAMQMALVLLLYLLRFGVADGFQPGLHTALQLLLFFLPGVVMIRTTNLSRLMGLLRRRLPEKPAFVIFTSLRFVPLFAAELAMLRCVQSLRGAPLTPRKLINPLHWRELFTCLLIPMLVRAMEASREAALSAESRGFCPGDKPDYYHLVDIQSDLDERNGSNDTAHRH